MVFGCLPALLLFVVEVYFLEVQRARLPADDIVGGVAGGGGGGGGPTGVSGKNHTCGRCVVRSSVIQSRLAAYYMQYRCHFRW